MNISQKTVCSERKRVPGTDYEIDRLGRVFRLNCGGAGVYAGYCKKPTMKHGRIIYQFMKTGARKCDSGSVLTDSARNFILRLFGSAEDFSDSAAYHNWLCGQAKQVNEKLKAERAAKLKERKKANQNIVPLKKNPLPERKFRLGSDFNALSTSDGYADAVGVRGHEINMADFCPFG